MRARAACALTLALALAAPACGGPPPRKPDTGATNEPHWQDVFDVTPELLFVVRPRALRQDKVYGPLLRRAIEAARQQSRIVAATGALDALENAGELVMGVRADAPPDHSAELVLVERGVPADLDPEAIVDEEGHALWAPGPGGRVRELTRERDEHGRPVGASLFELPGRTWVVATGDARLRAREAFAHPFGRPAMDLDPSALAIIRIDGPTLVARVHALQDLGGLASLGRHLRSVTFVLPPGGQGSIETRLAYKDEDAAAGAEVAAREVIAAVKRTAFAKLAWVLSATVKRDDKQVTLTTPLPPHLVEGLLAAGSAPLDVDLPPP